MPVIFRYIFVNLLLTRKHMINIGMPHIRSHLGGSSKMTGVIIKGPHSRQPFIFRIALLMLVEVSGNLEARVRRGVVKLELLLCEAEEKSELCVIEVVAIV